MLSIFTGSIFYLSKIKIFVVVVIFQTFHYRGMKLLISLYDYSEPRDRVCVLSRPNLEVRTQENGFFCTNSISHLYGRRETWNCTHLLKNVLNIFVAKNLTFLLQFLFLYLYPWWI